MLVSVFPVTAPLTTTMASPSSASFLGLITALAVLCCFADLVWSRPADSFAYGAAPRQSLDLAAIAPRLSDAKRAAGPSDLAGYLTIVFLGADPYIYFYLSDGNNPLAYKALNKGSPILRPTKGTGGVRDPAIVKGGGDEAGHKWYIVGTDLDIGKVGDLFSFLFWSLIY